MGTEYGPPTTNIIGSEVVSQLSLVNYNKILTFLGYVHEACTVMNTENTHVGPCAYFVDTKIIFRGRKF